MFSCKFHFYDFRIYSISRTQTLGNHKISYTRASLHVFTCRLDGISPSVSRMTSPTSGEYENDRSDFESGSVSPKQIDDKEETSQEPEGASLPKKEITRSKTETSINMKHTSTVTERHSVGGILSPGTDAASKQNKFSFLPKRKHSTGDYPPIPPKPSLTNAGTSSPKSSPSNSSKSSKNSTSPSPSFIKSLSPKNSAKSPPIDAPGPKTSATRTPTRSPLRSSYGKSHTLQKKDSYDDGNSRSRCATMGSQEAFHEHHMNKKRRRKSSDKGGARRFTAITDSANAKRTTGSTLISNKFDYQFSPDMEERLQLKIEQGIQNTYGPIEKCIQAAITIQRCYRQKQMLQRFKTLRKEVISVAALEPSRPRALSMKLPVRAYSIRLKSHPEVQVSILDEFPEYRKLTNRIASRNKLPNQALQVPGDRSSKDLGPSVRWRREASLEVQETVLQIADKSVTPVRDLSITEEDTGNDDDVFNPMPTPSPEANYSPSPESDPGQSIKQRKPSGVPTSLSVDFLNSSHEEEPTVRPHSISIMHHITRSKSMEELLVMDNNTGKPKKVQLRPQESATSLKKKTNIGITLFNRSAIYYNITKTSHCIIVLFRKPAKGILYLVLQGILNDSPKDVAHFIRTQYGLSKAMIGKFFSELHNEFSMAVLE